MARNSSSPPPRLLGSTENMSRSVGHRHERGCSSRDSSLLVVEAVDGDDIVKAVEKQESARGAIKTQVMITNAGIRGM